MGGLRFTVGALQQIVLSKTHAARIAILPQDQAEPLLQDVATEDGEPDMCPLVFTVTPTCVARSCIKTQQNRPDKPC